MGPPAKWLSGCKASTAGSNPALPASEYDLFLLMAQHDLPGRKEMRVFHRTKAARMISVQLIMIIRS
jgi:hypothetical protein